MKFDKYELSTIHYTLFYYMENVPLDEEELEWLHLLREKVNNIMVSQAKYESECG